jgi:hypothetical protein
MTDPRKEETRRWATPGQVEAKADLQEAASSRLGPAGPISFRAPTVEAALAATRADRLMMAAVQVTRRMADGDGRIDLANVHVRRWCRRLLKDCCLTPEEVRDARTWMFRVPRFTPTGVVMDD